jgi:DNA invertase Pin-like site-specific DNA recombinase
VTDLHGLRAARLLRVSTRDQDPENQEVPTAEFIAHRGMVPAETYKLKGASARKGQQVPAVMKAIEDFKRGLYDTLVIRAIDRLDRRGARYGWQLLGELIDAGVKVLSVADPELERIDTDPMAEAIVGMKLSLARQEVDDKRRRIHDAMRRIDEAGGFRGSVPAGYMVTGDKYGKKLVPDLANQRGKGSFEEIAQAIRDAGTGTSTLKLGARLGMTADAVGKMLRNTTYSTGLYVVTRENGTKVAHRTTPAVDPGEQARAIAALEARRTGDNVSTRINRDDYSTALFCWACLSPKGRMQRYFGGGKVMGDGRPSPRVRRYRCQNPECGKSVRADDADLATDELMLSQPIPWMELVHVPGNDHAAELERVMIEMDALSGRRLSDEEDDAERQRLRAERDRLKALPIVRPSTKVVWGSKTWADHWRELDLDGKRTWLLGGAFRVIVRSAGDRSGAVEADILFRDDGEELLVVRGHVDARSAGDGSGPVESDILFRDESVPGWYESITWSEVMPDGRVAGHARMRQVIPDTPH